MKYKGYNIGGTVVILPEDIEPLSLHGQFDSMEEGKLFLESLNEFELARWLRGENVFASNPRTTEVKRSDYNFFK